jgi:hypothetical protein
MTARFSLSLFDAIQNNKIAPGEGSPRDSRRKSNGALRFLCSGRIIATSVRNLLEVRNF